MIKHAVSRLRRMTTIIGSLAVAVFLMAAMPYVGKSHPTGTAKAIPKITEKIPPPPFESTINTLGITKYASAYAGERITRSGHLIIYIVRPKAGAFLAAVRHASVTPHSGPSSYTLVPVQHSWAQLNAVTNRIFSGLKELRANGIKLAQWGPDPTTNKVQITLESYSTSVVHKLLTRYGSQWIAVSRVPERWVSTATRFTDTSPFFGGDAIWFSGQSGPQCTSGLSFIGNNSGNSFTLVAGHCVKDAGGGSGTTVYTNTSSRQTLGKVSTQYYPGNHVDIASVSGSFGGFVYGDGSTEYFVIGSISPGRGAQITADGYKSGEVRKVTIENTNQDITIDGVALQHLTVASKSGATVCQVGDSGGPWFQHNNTTNQVNAVGIQTAVRFDLLTMQYDPSVCTFEQINNMLTIVNGSIQKG